MAETKELGAVARVAQALKISPQNLYVRMAAHKVSVRGMSVAELFEACRQAGVKIPPSAPKRLAEFLTKGRKPTRRSNGHGNGHGNGLVSASRDDAAKLVEQLARRLHLIRLSVTKMEQHARERIAAGIYSEDDADVLKVYLLAQTGGAPSELQKRVPDNVEA